MDRERERKNMATTQIGSEKPHALKKHSKTAEDFCFAIYAKLQSDKQQKRSKKFMYFCSHNQHIFSFSRFHLQRMHHRWSASGMHNFRGCRTTTSSKIKHEAITIIVARHFIRKEMIFMWNQIAGNTCTKDQMCLLLPASVNVAALYRQRDFMYTLLKSRFKIS